PFRNSPRHSPFFVSQIRDVWSFDPVARMVPARFQVIAYTPWPWPFRVRWSFHAFVSQIRTEQSPSSYPAASHRPSGLKATSRTGAVPPSRLATSDPVTTFQIRTRP